MRKLYWNILSLILFLIGIYMLINGRGDWIGLAIAFISAIVFGGVNLKSLEKNYMKTLKKSIPFIIFGIAIILYGYYTFGWDEFIDIVSQWLVGSFVVTAITAYVVTSLLNSKKRGR